MEKQNSYTHILKYTGLFGGVQGINILVGLVRNKLVALILGTMGMGLLALYSSTIKLVGDSTNLGLAISAVRDISAAYESGDRQKLERRIAVFRHWCLLTSLLGFVVCLAMAPWLDEWTFSSGSHTLQFILLAPVVGFTTFSSGELAILKATRQLQAVAVSSLYLAIATLLLSVPIYYVWGNGGVVPSLVVVTLAQMLIAMRFSMRAYPMRLRLSHSLMKEGYGFVGLGLAFVMAGMAASGAEMGIRAFLNHTGGTDVVGLYNAAYVMIFTYAGMVFTAMETDYYPRLSSIEKLGGEFNAVVNTQIEVSLHLVSPLLVVFVMAMPLLLPAMYSGKFLPVLPMMQVAALSMYARAMYLPIEYISLSRGDSLTYFFVEATAAALLLAGVIVGYNVYGLWGAGLGITVASFTEFLFVCLSYRLRYGYVLSPSVLSTIAVHVAVGLSVYGATLIDDWRVGCMIGFLLFAFDSCFTMNVLRKNTDIIDRIKGKLKKFSK